MNFIVDFTADKKLPNEIEFPDGTIEIVATIENRTCTFVSGKKATIEMIDEKSATFSIDDGTTIESMAELDERQVNKHNAIESETKEHSGGFGYVVVLFFMLMVACTMAIFVPIFLSKFVNRFNSVDWNEINSTGQTLSADHRISSTVIDDVTLNLELVDTTVAKPGLCVGVVGSDGSVQATIKVNGKSYDVCHNSIIDVTPQHYMVVQRLYMTQIVLIFVPKNSINSLRMEQMKQDLYDKSPFNPSNFLHINRY